ncbi:MAG: hypothetical protein Q4F00_06280 [bacterium]|nr:hypothetical protein [bacterium]
MKKYTSYLLGIMLSSSFLSLPAEAGVNIANNYSAAEAADICSEAADSELLANSASPSCELAMDTEDAILTGILGAAVIGAAVIASNDHHHRETVIVEQAPPPPPPAQTIVISDNTQHRPGYVSRPRHRSHAGSCAPAPPRHTAHSSRPSSTHSEVRHVSHHTPKHSQPKAKSGRQERSSQSRR